MTIRIKYELFLVGVFQIHLTSLSVSIIKEVIKTIKDPIINISMEVNHHVSLETGLVEQVLVYIPKIENTTFEE